MTEEMNAIQSIKMSDIIKTLQIGSSVAEFDQDLAQYFVKTHSFETVLGGDKDIISGDKGCGKTAIFRLISENTSSFSSLNGIDILPAFNIKGNPIFRRLATGEIPSEGECAIVWKCYFASLIGNWLLKEADSFDLPSLNRLESVLQKYGLYEKQIEPTGWFEKACNWVKSWGYVKSASVEFSANEMGIPTVAPKLEFGNLDPKRAQDRSDEIESLLKHLNACMEECGAKLWVVLDRLDEAFDGYPNVEIPALKALFRVYLDMQAFPQISLKLFVRNDLFNKITSGGFVNLTHINAKRLTISWDDNDLISMICNRIRKNDVIKEIDKNNTPSDILVLAHVLPAKVESGSKKSTSINWMLKRITDGKGIRTPRNLIDFFSFAFNNQCKIDDRRLSQRIYEMGIPLIEADTIRKAFIELSKIRSTDTLIAENPIASNYLNKFKGNKAEHNVETISKILDIQGENLSYVIKLLVEIGFIKETENSYIVPLLYRPGFDIKQGKAFVLAELNIDDEIDYDEEEADEIVQ